MSWKSEIAQIILDIQKQEFTTDDLWQYLPHLSRIYPNAKTPTVTVLSTLGTFRDMGALLFVRRGVYRITTEGQQILQETADTMNWHRRILRDWDKYYPQYMESAGWRAKRVAVLERDAYLCICGVKATVVHHKRYDNIGKEPLSDLVALCKQCHRDLHNKKKNFGH